MDLPHLPHIFSASFCAFVCVWTVSSSSSATRRKKEHLSFSLGHSRPSSNSIFFFLAHYTHAHVLVSRKDPDRNAVFLRKTKKEERERERLECLAPTSVWVRREREKEKQKVVPNSKLRKQRDKVQKTFWPRGVGGKEEGGSIGRRCLQTARVHQLP